MKNESPLPEQQRAFLIKTELLFLRPKLAV
jgi:hypothetical protein